MMDGLTGLGQDSSFLKLLQLPESERVLGVLGQGYLGSLLAGQPLENAILFFTDRYVYMKGNCFNLSEKQPVSRYTDAVIVLEEVTSCKVQEGDWWGAMLAGVGFILGGLFLLGSASTDSYHGSGWRLFGFLLGLFCLILGCGAIASAVRKFVVIEHRGGHVGVACRWYSEAEIDEFRRQLTAAIQSRRSGLTPSLAGSQHDSKMCPFCAETIKAAAIRCRYCNSDLKEGGSNGAG